MIGSLIILRIQEGPNNMAPELSVLCVWCSLIHAASWAVHYNALFCDHLMEAKTTQNYKINYIFYYYLI